MKKAKFKLDSEIKILTTQPTEENVFYLISKDSKAFTPLMMSKMACEHPIPNEHIKWMFGIYTQLLEKGYIRCNGIDNVITWRGKIHLIMINRKSPFWFGVLGIIIGGIGLPMVQNLINTVKPQNQQKELLLPIIQTEQSDTYPKLKSLIHPKLDTPLKTLQIKKDS